MKWIDLKGGVWLGIWSASVIAMSWFVVIADRGRDIPSGVVACYAAALTAFGGTKIAGIIKGAKDGLDRSNGADAVVGGPVGDRSGD